MDESVIIVKEGRHLLQELTVEGAFVPNDTYINIDKNIALITGIGLNSILNPYGDLRERNHNYNFTNIMTKVVTIIVVIITITIIIIMITRIIIVIVMIIIMAITPSMKYSNNKKYHFPSKFIGTLSLRYFK